jgi:hypothetical protein
LDSNRRPSHGQALTIRNFMKPYLATTATVFGLITVAHIARVFVEGAHLAADPIYILLTIAAAALCGWGWMLFCRLSRPRSRVGDS